MARRAKDETLDLIKLIKSGLATRAVDNKFGKSVRLRRVDHDPMDVNDEFTIPADYEVLMTSIDGSDPIPFILLPLHNPTTGITRNFRFFPNMLAKTIYPFVNGRPVNKVKTVGTAALEYQKFADQGDEGMDNAVKALVGRKIRITAKTLYAVLEYGTTNEVPTNIYTYDFVD